MLGPLLEDASVPKWGHDVKSGEVSLSRFGVTMRGVDFDTMLASYVLDSSRGGHGVDGLASERLGLAITPWDDVTGTGRARVPVEQAPLAALSRRAAEEVDAAFRLRATLEPEIDVRDPRGVLRELEMPLIDVLARMERAGVRVDTHPAFLGELSKRMDEELQAITEKAWAAAGEPFNLGSPKQVADLLFGKLGLRPRGRTKTGLSTNAAVLESLADRARVAAPRARYRQLTKLKSTYVDTLPALVVPGDGRVHTSFHQTVAATGACRRRIRTCRTSRSARRSGARCGARSWRRKGRKLISADYSQVELRIMAHLSQDAALLAAFRTARTCTRARRSACSAAGGRRRRVRAARHGEGRELRRHVRDGRARAGATARPARARGQAVHRRLLPHAHGRRPLPQAVGRGGARRRATPRPCSGAGARCRALAQSEGLARANAERAAINTPIQGSAADLLKVAMVRLARGLEARGSTPGSSSPCTTSCSSTARRARSTTRARPWSTP